MLKYVEYSLRSRFYFKMTVQIDGIGQVDQFDCFIEFIRLTPDSLSEG